MTLFAQSCPAGLAVTLSVTLVASPLSAHNESRATAHALDADRFEVIAEYLDNSVYWCGAASYAIRDLAKPTNQPIYVLQGPAPSRAKPGETAVTFGFSPPASGANSGLTNAVDRVGNTLSVGAARQTCFDTLVND